MFIMTCLECGSLCMNDNEAATLDSMEASSIHHSQRTGHRVAIIGAQFDFDNLEDGAAVGIHAVVHAAKEEQEQFKEGDL